MSLSETYLSRKKLLADNLKSMGVSSVNETDGLTTLINAVLDIEPSIGGLDLDTSLITTTTQEIIGLGESIILTSTLRASYDDTTVVDVDLSGVLTGATVKFYNGTTLLGTAITDLNGIATYTYTPSQLGNFTFHTVFEGTENFTNCNSNNVNITVIKAPTSLVLQADKSILSSYDNDNCVLTATLYDNDNTPMEGLGVVFKKGDVVLATVTTDSGGVAEYTYNSQGVGDITITAECMNLTETYSLEDVWLHRTDEYSRTQNSSVAVSNTVIHGFSWDNTVNWEFSCDLKVTGMGQRIDIIPPSESRNHHIGFGKSSENNYMRYYIGKSSSGENYITANDIITDNTYYPVTVIKQGTTVKWIFNDKETINTYDSSWLSNYSTETFKFTQWRANSIFVKNIKIKPLP